MSEQPIPTCDGWWLYDEDGMPEEQRILVIGGVVATDAEWARETGVSPSEAYYENYWAGTSVCDMSDGTISSGTWRREESR